MLSAVGEGVLCAGEVLLADGECWVLGDCPDVFGTKPAEASSSGSC